MFCSPRSLTSRPPTFLTRFVCALALSLLVFAPDSRAQSIPGIQSPTKQKSSVKQEISAQVKAARGEAPLGRLYDFIKIEPSKLRRLPALDPSTLQPDSREKRLRIGTTRTFSKPLKVAADSVLYNLPEGEVRVMGVVSEGARYTRVRFQGMALPAGARVFVSSLKNPEEFYGPYEGRGPSGDGTFWTPPVEGDAVVIEYFTPQGATPLQDAPFQISEISHIFTDPFRKAEFVPEAENAAGACNLEVVAEWANVATSVGYLQFTDGIGEYACTGTLLNNESNDFTPYLLTANHCFDQQAEAQTLRVYWHYNTGDSPPAGTPFTDGANLLSTSNSSDFTLVRLTGTVPDGLFYSGWDATPTSSSTSVTGIHHPQASHKRISFGTTITGCTIGPPSCDYYTDVSWSQGTTEPGSSGSGLWTGSPSDARLVGTLTGGAASCGNPSGIDYYGRFSRTYGYIASFLQRGDNGPDDNLEQNDARAAARSMESGTYSNLVVKGIDEDWYKVSVVAGGIVSVKVNYKFSNGNIDLQLYHANDLSPVSVSDGSLDLERVIHINQTGATADYYIRVFTYPGRQNSYNLIIGGAGAACAPGATINFGQTVNGTLSTSDCQSGLRPMDSPTGSNFYADRYSFTAQQGEQIVVTMQPATPFNTFLIVQGITGSVAYSELPNGGKPGSTISFLAPNTGTYTIEATSYDPNVTGNYQLTLGGQPETISVAQLEYTVREDEGSVAVVINRGPNALIEATVGYATSDPAGLDACNRIGISASSRCDFATTMGTLRFAPGERSKTIYIPLVDDAFIEGRESLSLVLYNFSGAVAGQYPSAMIYINDNDSVAGANPTDQTSFFIRQHYIDFLGREPDPASFVAWQNILNNCAPGSILCDRVEVSSAFFRSPEFQDRGYFIYRFYTALGRIPHYQEFIPDIAKVSGFLTDQQLETNKAAFVNEFMARGEFQVKYPLNADSSSYVNALLQTLGLPNHPAKGIWIAGLTGGTLTRAQVLRSMLESSEVYHKYYTEAFVVMQYFGYLRRNPDALYLEWIRIMNQLNGDYRGMIHGFVNSQEYRDRFGPR